MPGGVKMSVSISIRYLLMKKELLEAERAEFIQSIKALFIPLSLFLSCVIFAAGLFLVYNDVQLGWAFITVAGVASVSAIIALIRFQNTYRARGIVSRSEESDLESVGAERQ